MSKKKFKKKNGGKTKEGDDESKIEKNSKN